MIAVSDAEKKKKKSKCLAVTRSGERAYYIDPMDIRKLGIEYDPSRTRGIAESGDEWFPSILDNGRLTAFIAGIPGAGKSYLAAELIQSLPADYQVLLFTTITEMDGNFRPFASRVHKIRMEVENIKKMTLSVIRRVCRHPILLFDDVDKIADEKLASAVVKLMGDALANGRGHERHDGVGDIHVICTSHALNDYRNTKYSLENSEYVAVFPGSTTFAQLLLLFTKMGLDRDLCRKVFDLGKKCAVRRVIIRKVAPQYMIIGNEISLL